MSKLLPLATLIACLAGCADDLRPFPPAVPMWTDPDRTPFAPKPEKQFLPRRWTHADHMFFRPVARLFAVDPGGEAVNVNALDEVPSSSWFENRIGNAPLSPAEIARGPCREAPFDPTGPLKVVSGKPDGVYPGFVVEDPRGRRFLLKLDIPAQPGRATAAEVIASRIYHAAGFHVPCYELVFVPPSALRIAPGATVTTYVGDETPLTPTHLRLALQRAVHDRSGRFRASASRYLEGEPLGPWLYSGTLDDDPNDIVPHEDRRELRASRLLAAWTDHFDQEAKNTLATWIEVGTGRGYVQHALIDFGDCFGTIWKGTLDKSFRRGLSYFFDAEQIAGDFASLGIVSRPWDGRRLGPTGMFFYHYDAEHYDAEGWKPSFPNPAFVRMTERDGAWMARIIARFGPAHLRALVERGALEPPLEAELLRTLAGRREKILNRYLLAVSPLTEPLVIRRGSSDQLCLTDLGARHRPTAARRETARAWRGWPPAPAPPPRIRRRGYDHVCVELPRLTVPGDYLMVDVWTVLADRRPPPARVHLRGSAMGARIVGLERPYE